MYSFTDKGVAKVPVDYPVSDEPFWIEAEKFFQDVQGKKISLNYDMYRFNKVK